MLLMLSTHFYLVELYTVYCILCTTQQAWPDDSVDMGGVKLNMAKVEELLKGHALLPALTQVITLY
jgi:hypothetical protein